MIEIQAQGLEETTKFLSAFPNAIKQVEKKASRAAMKGIKQEAAAKVAERYTIQKSRIGRTMRVSYKGMGASFTSRGPVNDLAYFKHNPRAVPKHRPAPRNYLYSQVVKGQGGTIAHAFLARMRSGHVGVFRRTAGNESLPIAKLAGPSVPQMVESAPVRTFLEERLAERFAEAFEQEANAYLGRQQA